VTIEEGAIAGGAGEAVAAYIQRKQQQHPVLTLGLPDVFIEHGDPTKLLANVGLSPVGIQSAVESRFY
jgi:1-deoxy-D-xylulose-5-phosphate synthase